MKTTKIESIVSASGLANNIAWAESLDDSMQALARDPVKKSRERHRKKMRRQIGAMLRKMKREIGES